MEYFHASVLLTETVNALITNRAGIYVDCTLGGSGHAQKIVEGLTPAGRLVGIDQDPAAIAEGNERLRDSLCRVDLVAENFRRLDIILNELGISAVDGILFDLGVSSHQLDNFERGFSYMHNARLDMRMNPEDKISAWEVVNTYGEEQLHKVIREYGEERWAGRIAKFIVRARRSQNIETTGELVTIIKQAIPAAARREGPHPAKRTFQAIRIEVNNELGILPNSLTMAINKLRPGGRLCVITFHSLEDRIVKQLFQTLAKGCVCPAHFPVCVCGQKPTVKIIGKPIKPSPAELAVNSRARSAKLRVIEKL